MIARDLADLLHAVRIGKMKWIANCPAHGDRDFELTITHVPGCGARVKCAQHCSIDDIVQAIGISRAELESHPGPEPDMEDLDDAAARRFYAAKIKRQDEHQIVCGQIPCQLREVHARQRQSDNARKARRDDVSFLTDAIEGLQRLRDIERKWRVPRKD